MPQAYDLLTQAIEVAPDFALAYASRAEASVWFGWIDESGTALTLPDFEFPFPAKEAQARVDADIEKALALGSGLAGAHVSYQYHSSVDWNDISSVEDLATQILNDHLRTGALGGFSGVQHTGDIVVYRQGFQLRQL